MSDKNSKASFPLSAISGLSIAALGAVLLAIGQGDYPNLHIILDTALVLLSGVLALLFWNTASHTGKPLPGRLAIVFGLTFLLNLIHVLVTVEWSGPLEPIAQIRGFLRPATWPPSTHLLPTGIGAALWMTRRGSKGLIAYAVAMTILAAVLFFAFQQLPTYTQPTLFGITRPAVILSPMLWAAVAFAAWRLRESDRLVPPLVWLAATLFLANAVMLYSRAPADAPAMIAHLGRAAAQLVLLLFVMQMASQDIAERIRAESKLASSNAELDARVREQTAQLRTTNNQLVAEMAERRKSHDLLQAIIENTPAVVYVKDLDGRYLLINRRYAEIFRIDRAAVIGKTDYDLFTKEEADAFRALDERVARADRALTEEEQAPQDDGVHSYISVKAPLRDDNGRPYAVFGISTDITDLKRAREALAESEERARLIVETALDAAISIDSAGAVIDWGQQAEKTFGWTREEVLGRPLAELIIPEPHRAGHRDGLARYFATGEARILNRRIEISALHRDGHEFPVELSITAIRTKGTVTFSGFARDITERKAAEAKLRTQLERMSLLDQITRAIGEREDIESIFQVVVRSIEDQLPADFACLCLYDRTDNVLDVAHVGAKSAPLALSLAMSERARIDIDENGLARCVTGQLVYEPDISQSAFPFPQRLARGGLSAFVAAPLQVESKVFGALIVGRRQAESFSSGECEFLRQLSEHVALASHQAQIYQALQQAYDDLRQSQEAVTQQERLRALGQMASGIAHDINNALSPVALYTESMLETEANLSPSVRGNLEIIQRAVGDVTQTISRMKEFYRQREPQLALAPVRLNDLVRQVLDLTKARWSDMAMQRGVVVQVETELADDLPPAMGVESEIREALINLVFNAVDAMPQGGCLTVRTKATITNDGGSGVADVEVEDNGAGMDEETRRRCLEPFFTTKGERGTGLGLAMVYGVAQRHGAELDIRSVLGQGTVARLSFPAPPDIAPTVEEADTGSTPPMRLRLLLVDDDPV
ncbi:MAG: PAS domain S-box protein, partial [Hyphomonadaceae bacterium]|nr:PAS domain S-box protein [Hyphomonadaceae bacterium]